MKEYLHFVLNPFLFFIIMFWSKIHVRIESDLFFLVALHRNHLPILPFFFFILFSHLLSKATLGLKYNICTFCKMYYEWVCVRRRIVYLHLLLYHVVYGYTEKNEDTTRNRRKIFLKNPSTFMVNVTRAIKIFFQRFFCAYNFLFFAILTKDFA